LLLNPIHINQSETDVSVSDINKWANSRDPEGTAAQGEKGQRHIFAITWIYKEGLRFYTVPCFAFLVGTEKCSLWNTESGVPDWSEDGCLWEGRDDGC